MQNLTEGFLSDYQQQELLETTSEDKDKTTHSYFLQAGNVTKTVH